MENLTCDNKCSSAEELLKYGKKRNGYKGFYQLVFKRVVDIIVCLVALPFVLLIIIPIAIIIKAEDHGPVFYRSMRLGKGFREFGMLKFRSMKVNAPDLRNEDGSTYNSEDDPRVTKIGKFLRETSLDELPQFFNVLAERLIANGFTDQRLTDAVNNLIDNFKFKELNIADIVKFDKKMKLYNYKEACKLVTEDGFEFGKDLQRISMDDNTYWIMKHK